MGKKITIIAEIDEQNKANCKLIAEETLEAWEFAFLVMQLLKTISKAWEDIKVGKK